VGKPSAIRATAYAALAAGALILTLAGAPEALGHDRCSARGAKTVLSTAKARVFSVPIRNGRNYYGCIKGSRPIRLTTAFTSPDPQVGSVTVTTLRLSGSFVAWLQTEESDFGVGEFSQTIYVRPLRRGGRKLTVSLSERDTLAALALRGDGAVAWIRSISDDDAEVDKVDSTARKPTVLSSAPGIDPSFLSVDEDSVDWREGGSPKSAPLR